MNQHGANMPAAEVELSVDLVRRMVAAQFPQYADLEVSEVANGWDNVVYRLGAHLGLRVPRRQMGADLIENEVALLPLVAPDLPLPVPAALHVGEPQFGYPWRWTICPWFEGRHMGLQPPADAQGAARDLAVFLAALHRPFPAAPANPFGRGAPLSERDELTRQRIELTVPEAQRRQALDVWQLCLSAPVWDGPPMLLHGDMHVMNLVVDDQRLVAVIDFGDICSGDPACDLAVAWMFPDTECTSQFRAALARAGGAADEATWLRALGWALGFAVTYLANSADHPELNQIGRHTLERALLWSA